MAKHCIVGKDYSYHCEVKDCRMKGLCRRMYDEKEMGYSD